MFAATCDDILIVGRYSWAKSYIVSVSPTLSSQMRIVIHLTICYSVTCKLKAVLSLHETEEGWRMADQTAAKST